VWFSLWRTQLDTKLTPRVFLREWFAAYSPQHVRFGVAFKITAAAAAAAAAATTTTFQDLDYPAFCWEDVCIRVPVTTGHTVDVSMSDFLQRMVFLEIQNTCLASKKNRFTRHELVASLLSQHEETS
jgi:hypothetical protein